MTDTNQLYICDHAKGCKYDQNCCYAKCNKELISGVFNRTWKCSLTGIYVKSMPCYVYSFFLVWNLNNHNPKKQHMTEEEAGAEAERLAEKHPGERFVVLRAMSEVTCELNPKIEIINYGKP